MKLVVLNVVLPDQLEMPSQQLEDGEFIVRRVVQLTKLNDELKGMVLLVSGLPCSMIICIPCRLRNKGTTRHCIQVFMYH
jgi:hypothetical protein